jgi:hypothetical protein
MFLKSKILGTNVNSQSKSITPTNSDQNSQIGNQKRMMTLKTNLNYLKLIEIFLKKSIRMLRT